MTTLSAVTYLYPLARVRHMFPAFGPCPCHFLASWRFCWQLWAGMIFGRGARWKGSKEQDPNALDTPARFPTQSGAGPGSSAASSTQDATSSNGSSPKRAPARGLGFSHTGRVDVTSPPLMYHGIPVHPPMPEASQQELERRRGPGEGCTKRV